jgi:cation:H+ antiporter
MQIFINFLFLIFGFVFLIKGADYFVISASSIARKFHVSPLIIGLTLVAFGTSLPELAVSFAAALTVAPGATADIAMGNVIGSNIVNITMILGLSAIAMPILVNKSMIKREFPFLIGTSILIAILSLYFQNDAQISRFEAVILLLSFSWYLFLMISSHKNTAVSEEIHVVDSKKALILLFFGLSGVVIGGYLVTSGAEYLAIELLVDGFGVDPSKAVTLVGLSVVAIGTSLPELATSVVAAKKGENEIALGNIVGSNIFNVLFILGISGVVTPLGINNDVLIDTVLLIGITITAVIFSITGQKISKIEGWILVIMYVTYIAYIILRALGII